jgi:peptidyl-tRNA hydrolase
MKLIVGLGIRASHTRITRHNVGWWVIDHLAGVWRFEDGGRTRTRWSAMVASAAGACGS